MKTQLLACAISALSTLSAFTQGTIIFRNDSSTLVITNDMLGHVGVATTNTSPRIALYYSIAASAPAVDPFENTGWTLSSPATPTAVGTPLPGRFIGGTQTLDSLPAGDFAWLMVRAWTGGYSDWDSAVDAATQPGSNVLLGYTGTWFQQSGNPKGEGLKALVLGPSAFDGLTLAPAVPEPSMIALYVLGGIVAVFSQRWLRLRGL